MEMKDFYENLSVWEQDLGLPEGTWTDGLLDSSQEDIRRDQLLEGESFWKDADFPLKAASKEKVIKDGPISLNFDLDPVLIQDDWLDERIDIGAVLEDFIQSPEFETVFNDIDPVEYLKEMDLTEQSSEAISTTIVKEDVIENGIAENESTTEVEIETNEVTFDETDVIYLNPCEVSSPSTEYYATSESNEIHFVISPSISNNNEEIVHTQGSILPILTFDAHSSNGKTEAEDSAAPSLKAKTSRIKPRVEPYRSTWEGSNSSSSSSGIYNSSSLGSPLSSDLSDSQDTPPKGKRKERKKCQNRNAATKYRQKKRAQSEAIDGEELVLENKNKELKEKVNQLSSEIGYLKGLMREILIAKGLINK